MKENGANIVSLCDAVFNDSRVVYICTSHMFNRAAKVLRN